MTPHKPGKNLAKKTVTVTKGWSEAYGLFFKRVKAIWY